VSAQSKPSRREQKGRATQSDFHRFDCVFICIPFRVAEIKSGFHRKVAQLESKQAP